MAGHIFFKCSPKLCSASTFDITHLIESDERHRVETSQPLSVSQNSLFIKLISQNHTFENKDSSFSQRLEHEHIKGT